MAIVDIMIILFDYTLCFHFRYFKKEQYKAVVEEICIRCQAFKTQVCINCNIPSLQNFIKANPSALDESHQHLAKTLKKKSKQHKIVKQSDTDFSDDERVEGFKDGRVSDTDPSKDWLPDNSKSIDAAPAKRGRGRPRKSDSLSSTNKATKVTKIKIKPTSSLELMKLDEALKSGSKEDHYEDSTDANSEPDNVASFEETNEGLEKVNLKNSSISIPDFKHDDIDESLLKIIFDSEGLEKLPSKENLTNVKYPLAVEEIEENGVTKFKCKLCDCVLNRKSSMSQHLRVHAGKKTCILIHSVQRNDLGRARCDRANSFHISQSISLKIDVTIY